MNPPPAHFIPSQWRRPVAIVAAAALLAALLVPSARAQTLMLKFGFEDTGTTTVDSIASVPLNLVDTSGAAADLHGAVGTGVGGSGKALDFTSATGAQTASPLAYATNNASLGFGSVGTWTFTEWVKPVTGANLNSVLPRFFILGTNGTLDAAAVNAMGAQMENNGTSLRISVNNGSRISTGLIPAIALNTWSFIAYTYDGTTLRMYSGTETNAATLVTSVALTAANGAPNFGAAGSLFLGNRNDRLRGLKGYLDDLRFYSGAGDATFVEAVRQVALADPNVSATIIAPTNNPVYAGSPITLSATYGGTAPFSAFTWQSDGATGGATWSNLPGSTTNSYALNTTGMAAGTYQFRLIVTGALGTVTNTPAAKTIVAASGPIIVANTTVTPPAVSAGSTVTARATFDGTQPISYQWLFTSNSVTFRVTGATSNVLTLLNVQSASVGTYSLIASNNPGGVPTVVTSTPASLTVVPNISVVFADLGAAAPVAGAFDIAQLSTFGNVQFPDTLNYYDDNLSKNPPTAPGQTFTTGNDAGGYAVNAVYIKYGGIDGAHNAGVTYTLRFYSMSGSTAALLATCQNTNPTPAVANGDWVQFSGLTNLILQTSTSYAYTLAASGGFEQVGNAANSPSFYAGGELVMIPAAGGTVTFGASHNADATFLVNLLHLSGSSVATNPTNLTSVVTGGTNLALSWPADHLGWFLQSQTNSRSVGLKPQTNFWFDVPGSDTLTNTSITIDKTSPTVFFRLRSP